MTVCIEQGDTQHKRACDLVGGLLQVPVGQLRLVLDAGCGQGFWARELAHSHPSIQVIGIDSNEQAIQQARKAAECEKLNNVTFLPMDVLQPLNLPQFDLIFARYVFLHLPRQSWLEVVQSLKFHLRPGGFLQLIDGGLEKASTPAWQELLYIFERLVKAMGQDAQVAFSFTRLLAQAGLHIYRCSYHPLLSGTWEAANFSPHHALVRYVKARPFIEKAAIVSPAYYAELLRQAELEMCHPDFQATGSVISVIGYQPGEDTQFEQAQIYETRYPIRSTKAMFTSHP